MLRSLKDIIGYHLDARDGDIGKCADFLFDDRHWVVRYMVASTKRWLLGRKVLISPIVLGQALWTAHTLGVELTREQIESAPPLDEDAPVSRQHEHAMFSYYGWRPYWVGPGLWGTAQVPHPLRDRQDDDDDDERSDGDSHLRSADEVLGYRVQVTDGQLGTVRDFIVDDESWAIRYLVVDTRKWLPGKKVLLAPNWIHDVDWAQCEVRVELDEDHVKSCPEYDPNMPVNRQLETRLYDFYGRPKYWEQPRS